MAATTIVELQRAIARLQEGELQKLMVAQGNNEFAFVTIDQAAVPREPSAPRVMVVLAVAIVAAVMIIVSLVISQLALQRYRRGRIAG